MKPLDSHASTGLIAPEAAAPVDTGDSPVSWIPDLNNAIQDVPLVPVPAEAPTVESPELVMSQRISDDPQGSAGIPAGGMPGLSGNGGADAHTMLTGAADQAFAQADTALGVVHQGAQPVIDAAAGAIGQAQTALGQAQSAVNQALGGGAAPAASTPGAAATTMPADPVGALLNGTALPALPGIDVLFQPIRDLLSSFGTGVMGAIDPTAILSQSSQLIEMAMSVGKNSLSAMGQNWSSEAATTAQTAGQEANASGMQTSQRGIDISALTQAAAAVVQQGNAQLTTIASSFLSQAVALAPVVLTPPAQAALIASATEHLGQAVTVTNITRGDLAGKTAELNGIVGQLVGPQAQQAGQVAQQVAQGVGEQASGLLSDGSVTSALEDLTGAAGADSSSTNAASLGTGGAGSTVHGSGGGYSGSGGVGGHGGSSGGLSGSGGGVSGSPVVSGVPGGTQSPTSNTVRAGGLSTGLGGASGSASGTNSVMGSPAAAGAGQRKDDEEHSRTVDPYQSAVGTNDLTGPLGESAPQVIGGQEPHEEYTNDQF